MSFSIKSPINNHSDIPHMIINQNKNKVCNGPINVKMCQIPNNIGFNNKIKANIISSSYFNLNVREKTDNIIKNKNCKKARNKLGNDIKTNYYSLIIPNNRKTNVSINNANIFNNCSKLSINSLINRSINNSKKIINNRKKNLVNKEYSAISKQKNYSFKIKVNKIKENLILENSRNNSLKKNYNNKNLCMPKTVINKESIFNNQSNIKAKDKKFSKQKIKDLKNVKIMKNCSVKSIFKKINLNNKNNNNIIKNSCFLSYSEQNKKRNDKIKRKIINSSYLINNLSSFNQNNVFNKTKLNDINRMHSRNNTTSSNTKIIKDFSNINKVINKDEKKLHFYKNNSTSIIKNNFNKNSILNNLNIENIKLKNNYVISPKIKYGTHILSNDYSHSINYNSISDNINTLKNIIFKNNNNYNSNDNLKNYKKKLIKEIPAPKIYKNNNLAINKNNSNSIKNIKIKKIINNKTKEIKSIKNSKQIKKKKSIIHQNKEKELININYKDNYDRDDLCYENNNKDGYKNKISIVEILKKNKDFKNINVNKNKKNKSFIGKRIKSIKVEKKSLNESKNSKLINYNNMNSNKNISNNNNKKINNYYNINLNTNVKNKEEIINNKIDNTLFDKENLIDLSSDNDDKFDDLYSIIKKINFNSVLLNKEGIFSIGNKEYNNYKKKFDIIFKKNIKRKNIKYSIKKSEKMNSKDFTESTKMNTSSSKKAFFHKIKNDNFIKEFRLDDNKKNKNNEYAKIT